MRTNIQSSFPSILIERLVGFQNWLIEWRERRKACAELAVLAALWTPAHNRNKPLLMLRAIMVLEALLLAGGRYRFSDSSFDRSLLNACRLTARLAEYSADVLSSSDKVLIEGYASTNYVRDYYSDLPEAWMHTLDTVIGSDDWTCVGGLGIAERAQEDLLYNLVVSLPLNKELGVMVSSRVLCDYCDEAAVCEVLLGVEGSRGVFRSRSKFKYERVNVCRRDERRMRGAGNVLAVRALKTRDSDYAYGALTVSDSDGVEQLSSSLSDFTNALSDFSDLLADQDGSDTNARSMVRLGGNRSKGLVMKAMLADDVERSMILRNDGEREKQYTFTVVYKPDTPDSHNEYMDGDELQSALWQYVRAGVRDIFFQHGFDDDVNYKKAGEWVELASLPFPVEGEFVFADGKVEKRVVPAGSVWMGVVWEDWAWEKVKNGEIRGMSFGGTVEA